MTLDQLTNKETYKNITNLIYSHSLSFDINGVTVPSSDVPKLTASMNPASLTNKDNRTIKVLDYYAPSKIALDTYTQIGQELDKSIQCAFLLQTFGIKGTDILCSTFCFLISLLPCSTRRDLSDFVTNVNKGTQALKSAATAINNQVETLNATMLATGSILNNFNNAFGKQNTGIKSPLTNIESISTLIAVPQSIADNAKIISNALKFGQNFKFMMPDFTGKGIWDLAQNVLFTLQGIALQVADEAMCKIIDPVTDLINDINPGPCYNNLADRIRQNILQTIQSLKSRILKEIADLFTGNNGFNLKFRQLNKKLAWSLELLAFMEAMNYISGNFLQIARGCGIATCDIPKQATLFNPNDIGNLDATDTINPYDYYPDTEPCYINNYPVLKQESISNIDGVAEKFKDFMNTDNIHITPDNVSSMYTVYKNAPDQIKGFIDAGILNNVLNSNYTISNDKVITYQYNRNCGAN